MRSGSRTDLRFLLAPARGGSDSGRWIRALRLDALAIGEPKRVTLIADHGDAWTLEKAVELGAVWLTRVGVSERLEHRASLTRASLGSCHGRRHRGSEPTPTMTASSPCPSRAPAKKIATKK